jgi:hypothetical protein
MPTTTTISASATHSAHHVPMSIRVLRRLRPLIAAILDSPMHGVLSREILLLGWTGNKTGARYTLPISYTELGEHLYLCTRPEGSSWWRNVRSARAVDVVLKRRKLAVLATVLDPASPEALDGLRAFLSRNPGTGRLLYGVDTDAAGKPRDSDLEREVHRSIVVRLRMLDR